MPDIRSLRYCAGTKSAVKSICLNLIRTEVEVSGTRVKNKHEIKKKIKKKKGVGVGGDQ